MSRRHKRKRRPPPRPLKKRSDRLTTWVGPVVLVGVLAVVLAITWMRSGGAHRESPRDPHLPRCPVGGMPVNFAVRSQTNDAPVFFCCEHCIDKFVANPEDYAEGVRKQREFLAKMPRVQVRCPVSGEPSAADIVMENRVETVRFCSEECRTEYREDPSQYRTSLLSSYSYQVTCPVSGHGIHPAFVVSLSGGEDVYLCSQECRETFRRDPTSFADRLAAQGLRIRP